MSLVMELIQSVVTIKSNFFQIKSACIQYVGMNHVAIGPGRSNTISKHKCHGIRVLGLKAITVNESFKHPMTLCVRNKDVVLVGLDCC